MVALAGAQPLVRRSRRFRRKPYNLTGIGDPERLEGRADRRRICSRCSGLAPLLGRTLVPADDAADAPPVVVISERLWRRRFGADPDIVGRTIHSSGVERTVVGVVPPYFQFPEQNVDCLDSRAIQR